MKDQKAIESEIIGWLEAIRPVQPRNARAAQRSRARFLSQAVSASELPRHKGWKFIFRKEQFAMKVFMSFLVIASLLFGGGATLSAAQNDLPDEPLYGLKLWSEDLSLQFQDPSEEKVDRLMELARVRVQEMTQLNDDGKAVPDHVRLRFEEHIQQALEICSTMDDPAMDRTLLQLRDQLRERDQDMVRLQLRVHQDSEPMLERTREMLRLRLQLVEEGLVNHEMFRAAARNGFRHGQQDDFTPPTPAGNGQEQYQSTSVPGGPNTNPASPTVNPGGPNTEPGGPNTNPGGPNPELGGNMNGSGSGSGGSPGDSGGNGYGGNDSSGGNNPGDGSGGDGYGGGDGGGGGGGDINDGSGSGGGGGDGSGGNPGGGGSGGNRP
jgi:hypothetical protein